MNSHDTDLSINCPFGLCPLTGPPVGYEVRVSSGHTLRNIHLENKNVLVLSDTKTMCKRTQLSSASYCSIEMQRSAQVRVMKTAVL